MTILFINRNWSEQQPCRTFGTGGRETAGRTEDIMKKHFATSAFSIETPHEDLPTRRLSWLAPKPARWNRALLALALFVIAPLVGEFLAGNLPITMIGALLSSRRCMAAALF